MLPSHLSSGPPPQQHRRRTAPPTVLHHRPYPCRHHHRWHQWHIREVEASQGAEWRPRTCSIPSAHVDVVRNLSTSQLPLAAHPNTYAVPVMSSTSSCRSAMPALSRAPTETRLPLRALLGSAGATGAPPDEAPGPRSLRCSRLGVLPAVEPVACCRGVRSRIVVGEPLSTLESGACTGRRPRLVAA